MTYEWRKRAKSELAKASIYCAEQFEKRIAEKFIDTIDRQVERLAQHPDLGYLEPLLIGRRRSYRSLMINDHFKLVYYHDEQKDIIYIIDLWDTRRESQSLVKRIRGK